MARPRRHHDAIIIGARCAGATLAILLADAGWDVLLVDHRPAPAAVMSSHIVFPNTVARLAEIGVLERMTANHRIGRNRYFIDTLGHSFAEGFTPVDGFDYGIAPRRELLDKTLLDIALEKPRVSALLGPRVVDLVFSSTDEDRVTGVRLDSGETHHASWVFGADGRGSTVAGRLGLPKTREMAGNWSALYTYWRGLRPASDGCARLIAREDVVFSQAWCEDDLSLLFVGVPPGEERGGQGRRLDTFLAAVERTPGAPRRQELEQAEMVGPVRAVPESALRGFFRTPAGPGWALIGDACHFKHPATGQGISDALSQASFVATALCAGDGDLAGYESWRDEQAAEHYDFAYQMGRFPRPGILDDVYAGLAADADARQGFIDIFSRQKLPYTDVFTAERITAWQSPRPTADHAPRALAGASNR